LDRSAITSAEQIQKRNRVRARLQRHNRGQITNVRGRLWLTAPARFCGVGRNGFLIDAFDHATALGAGEQ
jgi:hypothetical protein